MIFCLMLFSFPTAKIYAQCIKGDCRDGYGVLVLREGYSYTGDFKNGRFDGYGTLAHCNGGKYEGGWKKGQYCGQGTLILPDGGKYVGGWKDSLPFGKGAWIVSRRRKFPETKKTQDQNKNLTQSSSTTSFEILIGAPF